MAHKDSNAGDPTRVYDGSDRDWLPIPSVDGAYIKVLVADRERRQVVFQFRFAPGTVLPEHIHHCQAIAYTISGEWEYEELKLPSGAVAYEPPGSTHTPSSGPGAEIVVVLSSDSDRFLENHMADGSVFEMDMSFFALIDGATLEQAAALDLPGPTA
jgi:quercetin dioxygenase-like cupin family protein